MTTLAGLVRKSGEQALRQDGERLLGALSIYQPERQGVWRQGRALLACTLRRFSPEDRYDQQPCAPEGRRPALVFCGRLDNREALARDLGLTPDRLAVLADSALVWMAWERWGEDLPKHLLGDFALAAWEPKAERLFLARDPLGMRPLYWYEGSGLFAFASAPQALFALPDVAKELDETRLAEYLALAPWSGPASFFRGVQRLEPGQSLVWEQGRVRTAYHHRFEPEHRIILARDQDYVEALRERVEAAVACRLRSAGEVGAHLSSGLDSGTICAVAAPKLAAQGRRLHAFTHVPREGFQGPLSERKHADEGIAAAALARRHPNMEHVRVSARGGHLSTLDRHADYRASPVLNPCNATWADAINREAAARGVRVLLIGYQGNLGLSYTGRTRLPDLLRQGRWGEWAREALASTRTGGVYWRKVLRKSIAPFTPDWLWPWLDRRRRGALAGLTRITALRPQAARDLGIEERARASGVGFNRRPTGDGWFLRHRALRRQDMGSVYLSGLAEGGLEMRDPTADVRLLEFCFAIPQNLFLRGGQGRWLVRQAFGERLPPEMLNARTKGLQAADWFELLGEERQELARELERLAASPLASRLLDLETLRRDLENWPKEGWERQEVIVPYRLRLLRGLSVGMFIRKMEGGNE